MSESISAADANRKFSQLLRGVREDGATYVVTAHGKPVAKIVPYDEIARETDREVAREMLLKRLAAQPVMNLARVSRDELYDD
jgi:prevent-host-death family protein